ncbi:Hypothetical Protein FCC1311_006342 [Hondaea fermentalgiana]|uniref:Uncharacterized protein n=1 Tax=Hondaea fermentalgiana TaxID=2315210 RepID=A0A2R5G062_9STRA|nr:Hypothetical Protein FCC1311_006342 [Hondaea fermentalgiana]|eukprot:GBG24416.1 Hypothetical Protein FCC1311_006342 [Hondaea fermentalgiana]
MASRSLDELPALTTATASGADEVANVDVSVNAANAVADTGAEAGQAADALQESDNESSHDAAEEHVEKRKPGGQLGKRKILRVEPRVKRTRGAAIDAQMAAKASVAQANAPEDADESADGKEMRVITSVPDYLRAFGFSESARKKLPSKEDREKGQLALDSDRLRALVNTLAASITYSAGLLYPGNPSTLQAEVGRKLLRQQDKHRELESLVAALTTVIKAAPKGSVQGRVARAILIKGASSKRVSELRASKTVSFGGSTVQRAYQDFNACANGEVVAKSKCRRSNFDEDLVRRAVRFLISPENVSGVPWALREVRLSAHEVVQIPVFFRIKSLKAIYEDYVKHAVDERMDTIARTSFYKVMSKVLASDGSSSAAGDAASQELLGSQRERLQAIIDDFAQDNETKSRLSALLGATLGFLLTQFDEHLTKDSADGVPTHDIPFGLQKPPADGNVPVRSAKCRACDFPFYFLDELRTGTILWNSSLATQDPERAKDAAEVIADTEHKFKLFQGFRALFLDQIVDGDVAQTPLTQASLLEAMLEWMHKNLPHITEIVLHCDFDDFRPSAQLPVMISLLNTRTPVKISRLLFSEHAEGKADFVAHFSKARRHILAFMRSAQRVRIRAIGTPRGLAAALAWDQGMQNCGLQFVQIDNNKNAEIASLTRPTVEAMERYGLAMCTDFVFAATGSFPAVSSVDAIRTSIESRREFRILAFAYAGMGSGCECSFALGFESNDEVAQNPVKLSISNADELVEGAAIPDLASISAQGGVAAPSEAASARRSTANGTNGGRSAEDQAMTERDYILETMLTNGASAIANYVVQDFASFGAANTDDGENDENEDVSDEDDEDSGNVPDPRFALDSYMYGSLMGRGSSFEDNLTGIRAIKRSNLRPLLGSSLERGSTKDWPVTVSASSSAPSASRTDMVAFAVRNVRREFDAQNTGHSQDMEVIFARAETFPTLERKQGWARRPSCGNSCSVDYVRKYEAQITDLFQAGLARISARLPAAKMRDRLLADGHGPYSLPSVAEVQRLLTRLTQREGNNGLDHRGSLPRTTEKRGRKSKVPVEVRNFMSALLEQDAGIKPQAVVDSIREKFPNLVDLEGVSMEDHTLKNAFATAKKHAML